MITGKAIYSILKDDATVGSYVGDRIYPTFTPQDATFPSIIYRVVDKEPKLTKEGPVGSTDQVLIEIYHDKALVTQQIGEAVKDALDRYRGTVETIIIDRINYNGETDEILIPDLALYHLSQNYIIRVKYY